MFVSVFSVLNRTYKDWMALLKPGKSNHFSYFDLPNGSSAKWSESRHTAELELG